MKINKSCTGLGHEVIWSFNFHGYTLYFQKYWHPLLMNNLTTLVIPMSTNLNVDAYNDILGNCVLLICIQYIQYYVWF